ncbi:MAG: hypothetical protein ACJA1A_002159 [Saprospiraceae bacterium]|jgi:hypothetical protein
MFRNKWNTGVLAGFIIIATMFLISCGGDSEEPIPDVSEIELSNKVVRFEQLMAGLDTNNLAEEVQKLNSSYPQFYSVYFRNVLPFDIETADGFLSNLKGYLSDKRIQELQDTTVIVFEDFAIVTLPKLNHAMKMMKHYFPKFIAPNFYTFVSEYTYQQFLFSDEGRDGVGIGLDMFLGADYPYKQLDPNNPAFSRYLTRTYNKEHLPRKITEILIGDLIGRAPGSRLLDHMIHNGKRLYILDKVLPTTPDSILLEYTSAQTKWVKENELSMWAFYFDENLFYESNAMKINKYINPSPTSPGMPDAAPGRTANYIGWKIVDAYMNKTESTLEELINIEDAQKIMDESRYKPGRRN